jgi:hypothetical protein
MQLKSDQPDWKTYMTEQSPIILHFTAARRNGPRADSGAINKIA